MSKKKMRLVIIGGGMAGSACLEEITGLDPDRYEITVFGAERHPNYNRVLLAQVLTGEKSVDEITLLDRDWYDSRGVRLLTGAMVTAIDRVSRKVVCADGTEEPYDRLILATGALPVIPPIPGADREGVVAFRNLADCERIKGLLGEAQGPRKAVVIGGGLLGLEAAWSLKTLGAEVTVVHLADRLMERQLDEAAAGLLKEDMEALGIEVRLGTETVEITGGERVEGLRFSDGEAVEADLVIMSVGIRPNAELARASGIYCEKGVLVGDTMQTYDPAVYAIGECVQHRGETFGLVAPIFEQARVLADHMAGKARLSFKNSPVPARLKVPGVELYSAGRVTSADGLDSIEYMDRGSGVYKKVLLRDNRVAGIVMYGDTSGSTELYDSMVRGEDVSARRRTLLFGRGAGDGGAPSVDEIPDEAIICGCKGVTKGAIVDAITSKGLFTREEVKAVTGASGSCGGCAGLVDRILEATLGPAYQAGLGPASLCGCTAYTRDDVVKNIREKGLRSVEEVMETLGWETVGCEVCRPAINYYVQMLSPGEATDDPTSRLINERAHANIQQDGTFSVVPRMYGGKVTPAELRRIAETAERFKVPLVKVTGGQRIGLYGIRREDLPAVWGDLDMPSGYAYAKALRTVKTCVGSEFCRYGTQKSLTLGVELERELEGLWTPAKVKVGVSGCPRSCAESSIKDVGIVGVAGGWEIFVGGCGGVELRGAERLATVETAEEVHEIVSAFLQLYREEAAYGERTFKWIERAGMKAIRASVVDDLEKRKALAARLRKALAARTDPWKERVPA